MTHKGNNVMNLTRGGGGRENGNDSTYKRKLQRKSMLNMTPDTLKLCNVKLCSIHKFLVTSKKL